MIFCGNDFQSKNSFEILIFKKIMILLGIKVIDIYGFVKNMIISKPYAALINIKENIFTLICQLIVA